MTIGITVGIFVGNYLGAFIKRNNENKIVEGMRAEEVYRLRHHPENPYLKIKFLGTNGEVSSKMKFCDSFYSIKVRDKNILSQV